MAAAAEARCHPACDTGAGSDKAGGVPAGGHRQPPSPAETSDSQALSICSQDSATQTSLCPTPTPSFLPPQILSGNCLLHELFSVETGLVAQACDSSYFLGLGSGTKSPRPARAPGQFGQVSETLSQSKRWQGPYSSGSSMPAEALPSISRITK